MNYINEIRAFYDIAESFDLSASCICLWHALMYQANKLGWMDEFSLPISTLELRTKLGKSAIYTARNTLKQHGLISVKERDGRQSSLYTVHSLCLFNGHKPEHNTDTNPNTTRTQTRTQHGLLNKQDNTRQDNNAKTTKSAREAEVGKAMSYFMDKLGIPSGIAISEIPEYAEAMTADAVIYAIDKAIDAKANWNYARVILSDWQRKGVKNKADAMRESAARDEREGSKADRGKNGSNKRNDNSGHREDDDRWGDLGTTKL